MTRAPKGGVSLWEGDFCHSGVDTVKMGAASSHASKEEHELSKAKPGRFVMHFTPLHGPWLKMVR
jgi:hypothetical protein